MRHAIVALAVAAACTRPAVESPAPMPRADVGVESVRVPADPGPTQVSGTVTKTGGGTMALDSGGPDPVSLHIDGRTEVIVDGQPGTQAQIREGDLVRAAYRYDEAGQPLALQVVANTRPVPTPKVTQPPPRPVLEVPAPSR